jgi:hypothetical protein
MSRSACSVTCFEIICFFLCFTLANLAEVRLLNFGISTRDEMDHKLHNCQVKIGYYEYILINETWFWEISKFHFMDLSGSEARSAGRVLIDTRDNYITWRWLFTTLFPTLLSHTPLHYSSRLFSLSPLLVAISTFSESMAWLSVVTKPRSICIWLICSTLSLGSSWAIWNGHFFST